MTAGVLPSTRSLHVVLQPRDLALIETFQRRHGLAQRKDLGQHPEDRRDGRMHVEIQRHQLIGFHALDLREPSLVRRCERRLVVEHRRLVTGTVGAAGSVDTGRDHFIRIVARHFRFPFALVVSPTVVWPTQ